MDRIRDVLDVTILPVGDRGLTLGQLLLIVVLLAALFYFSGRLKRWIAYGVLARRGVNPAVRMMAAALTRYAVIFVGLLLIFQAVGIDVTAITVLAGAVGIGIGFGLQNIVSNFVSGLILLFERPIKIGDRIEVDGTQGDVVEIGGRATTIVTNDDVAMIIPNSKFITEKVVNLSYTGEEVRFRIPVTVACDCDVREVERLLTDAAGANPDVLETPAPQARLVKFGDVGIVFELLVWTLSKSHRRGALTSALDYAVAETLSKHGIKLAVTAIPQPASSPAEPTRA